MSEYFKLMQSSPLLSVALLLVIVALVLYLLYLLRLLYPKKTRSCPASDCMNFNCGHFDKHCLACELTEVLGNE